MGLYEWDVLWAYMNGTSYGPNMNALPAVHSPAVEEYVMK